MWSSRKGYYRELVYQAKAIKKCQKALYRCDKDLIEHDFYKGDIMCDLVTKKTRPRDAFASKK